jgi:hypothetical protein
MKELVDIVFDPAKVQRELTAFRRLLESKANLSERDDLLPFFKKRQQLSAFIGTFAPDIGPAAQLAHEFPFFGDFAADIVLGNRERGEFCVVELEDGRPDSVFSRVGKKATREWSPALRPRLQSTGGLVLRPGRPEEDKRFTRDFGHGHVKFFGLLIVGRSAFPAEPLTFFIDRPLGRGVGEDLRAAGLRVELHDDHFAQDTQDVDWVREVTAHGSASIRNCARGSASAQLSTVLRSQVA